MATVVDVLARIADQQQAQELCFAHINHWSTCMTKAEWSGWVQAIGSVAAIAAAGYGIVWQFRRQAQAALTSALIDRLGDAIQLASALHEARSLIKEFLEAAQTDFTFWNYLGESLLDDRFSAMRELLCQLSKMKFRTIGLNITLMRAENLFERVVMLRGDAQTAFENDMQLASIVRAHQVKLTRMAEAFKAYTAAADAERLDLLAAVARQP